MPSRTTSVFFMVAFCWVVQVAVVRASDEHNHDKLPTSADGLDGTLDPSLELMSFDLGSGEEAFSFYMQPDVTTFYKDQTLPASTPVHPKHNGLAGKFINMSNRRLNLYWDAGERQPGSMQANLPPFESTGTATFPGHVFYLTPPDDPYDVLIEFYIEDGQSLYFYDPYFVPGDEEATERNLAESLNKVERKLYDQHRSNRLFNEIYHAKTGRDYLAMYPRSRPIHNMWRADYFGQEHWITTRETYFVEEPPEDVLKKLPSNPATRKLSHDAPRLLEEYREKGETIMNMTMKVISCRPRAFEIKNFLSDVEVDHALWLGDTIGLDESTTGDGSKGDSEDDDDVDNRRTRTSYNTWIAREKSPIVDAIYRRAADLLRIDEALLRRRGPEEYPRMANKGTAAETLQLVHYQDGQEYTAHHDFGYSGNKNPSHQSNRFATLLLYLNEGMEGGETSFPRWVNAEHFEELKITPEKGKAILFYSQLPDGNMDDLSQHAAHPVTDGEKWLMNLWVHDPTFG